MCSAISFSSVYSQQLVYEILAGMSMSADTKSQLASGMQFGWILVVPGLAYCSNCVNKPKRHTSMLLDRSSEGNCTLLERSLVRHFVVPPSTEGVRSLKSVFCSNTDPALLHQIFSLVSNRASQLSNVQESLRMLSQSTFIMELMYSAAFLMPARPLTE